MTTAATSLALVCVHEYAHLAVARAFGACGFVRIVRVAGPGTPPRYAGAFQMHGALDDHEWRRVALAGTLAEMVAANADLDARMARAALACGSVSLSTVDATLALGFDDEDVAASLALVRGAWPVIVDDARERGEALSALARTARR